MDDLFAVRVSGPAGGVVVCRGEMDICAEAPLISALDRAMKQSPTDVRVDLSEVDYIDSACIAVLLRARDGISRQGGRLVIAGLSPIVRRAFLLLGMDESLQPIR